MTSKRGGDKATLPTALQLEPKWLGHQLCHRQSIQTVSLRMSRKTPRSCEWERQEDHCSEYRHYQAITPSPRCIFQEFISKPAQLTIESGQKRSDSYVSRTTASASEGQSYEYPLPLLSEGANRQGHQSRFRPKIIPEFLFQISRFKAYIRMS